MAILLNLVKCIEYIDVLNNVVKAGLWLECGRRRRDYHEIGGMFLGSVFLF